MSALTPRGKATRLRVFAAVKAHMEATGECPSALSLSKLLGLSDQHVGLHMRALRHAAGLPFPIPDGNARTGRNLQASADGAWGSAYRWRDPGSPVPVDFLMKGPHA